MLFHATFLRGGAEGVDVFFVLSGYLITNILLGQLDRTGAVNSLEFFKRRAKRLLPALIVLLVFYALLASIIDPVYAGSRWLDIVFAACYMTNWREWYHETLSPLSHLWSLAIEGQFYIVWPLAVIVLHHLERRKAYVLLVVTWAVMTACRIGGFGGDSGPHGYFSTVYHSTGLILGSALAFHAPSWARGRGWLGIGAIAFVAIAPRGSFTALTIPLSELGAAAVILSPPAPLALKPLPWLGRISYGIYLWHIPYWHAFQAFGLLTQSALMIVASTATAAASWYLVERWFLTDRGRSKLTPVDGALVA
jgi:peptidoglycan/LPS O-acetylase OafA/YrhL